MQNEATTPAPAPEATANPAGTGTTPETPAVVADPLARVNAPIPDTESGLWKLLDEYVNSLPFQFTARLEALIVEEYGPRKKSE